MSTNFLNRRMDLTHEIGGGSISGTVIGNTVIGGTTITLANTNYLTMDTSYPVKLAGKVLKIFTASGNWVDKQWVLRNSEKETILTVTADNVFDFAGRQINQNVGDGKAYSSASDVYKTNDYVVVIIDFDNEKFLMCSETNFTKFITGDDVGNLKMFVIDGNTPIDGFDFPIDTSIFADAVAFENESGKYALVKNTDDEVVYEKPTINVNDDVTNRDRIPVAKVDNMDINCLNTSVQTLLYPTITHDSDWVDNGSILYINKLQSYMIVNGQFNSKFVNDFCYTNTELEASAFFNNLPDEAKSIYNSITNKSDFYYVLHSIDKTSFSSEEYVSSLKFIPIRKSDMTFATYFELPNHGFMVKGQSVDLPIYRTNGILRNYVGCDNDELLGYLVYHHKSCIEGGNLNQKIFDGNIYNYYMFRNDKHYEIDDDNSNIYYSMIIPISHQFRLNDNTGIEYDILMNNVSNSSVITNFIELFGKGYNNISGTRKINLKKMCFYWVESTNYHAHCFKQVVNNNTEICISPILNVVEYPGIYDPSAESIQLIPYYYDSPILNNNFRDVQIVYNLFNHPDISGYIKSDTVSSNTYKDVNTNLHDKSYKFHQLSQVKYEATHSLSYNQDDYLCYNSDYSVMRTIINIMSIAHINDNTTENDFIADIRNSQLIAYKYINLAKYTYEQNHDDDTPLYITSNGTLMLYNNNKYNQLYTVVPVNEAIDITDDKSYFKAYGILYHMEEVNIHTNFKKATENISESEYVYHQYMYYFNSYDGSIHRVKYYYREQFASNSTASIDDNYDYFTDNIVMSNIYCYDDGTLLIKAKPVGYDYSECIANIDTDINRIYTKAFLNYYCNTNNTKVNDAALQYLYTLLQDNTYWMLICLTVDTIYKISPSTYINNGKNVLVYEGECLSATSTYNLCIGIDERILYPGIAAGANEPFKLSALIQNDYYKTDKYNTIVPYLSNTLDSIGGSVFNVKSYLEYIKNQTYSTLINLSDGISDYINGYKMDISGSSLFDFYTTALTRDLSSSDAYFNTVDNGIVNLFTKDDVDIKNTIVTTTEYNGKVKTIFGKNIDGEFKISPLTSSFYIKPNISPKNIFGFNKSILYNSNKEDKTDIYISKDPIYINSVETGKRKILTMSIDNGDLYNNSMISINGNEGTIETDNITWRTLLRALNNNNEIDILSSSIYNIKTILNEYFLSAGQNVNSSVSIDDNVNDINLVNINKDNFTFFDTSNPKKVIYPYMDDSISLPDFGNYIGQLIRCGSKYYYWNYTWILISSSQMKQIVDEYNHFGFSDAFNQYIQDNIATFNDKYNLYNFNYGYGYQLNKSGTEEGGGELRQLNNRGVIVFETDGGESLCQHESGGVRTNYNNTPSNIYPKRMYISKDGLICTKEYFDRESATISDSVITLKQIQSVIESLQEEVELLKEKVYDLTDSVYQRLSLKIMAFNNPVINLLRHKITYNNSAITLSFSQTDALNVLESLSNRNQLLSSNEYPDNKTFCDVMWDFYNDFVEKLLWNQLTFSINGSMQDLLDNVDLIKNSENITDAITNIKNTYSLIATVMYEKNIISEDNSITLKSIANNIKID